MSPADRDRMATRVSGHWAVALAGIEITAFRRRQSTPIWLAPPGLSWGQPDRSSKASANGADVA